MNDEIKDAKVFAEAILNAEFGSQLFHKLCGHFADEMYSAIKGRICTPERMAVLYPIFREINIEMDEIEDCLWKESARIAKLEAKRLAKK